MTRDELLELLARLRCAPIGRAHLRAPHKPLLLLWLFGRFAASGSTVTAYADARAGQRADQRLWAAGRERCGGAAAGRDAVHSPGT